MDAFFFFIFTLEDQLCAHKELPIRTRKTFVGSLSFNTLTKATFIFCQVPLWTFPVQGRLLATSHPS